MNDLGFTLGLSVLLPESVWAVCPQAENEEVGHPRKGLTEIRSLKMTTDKSTRNIRFLYQLAQYLSENILCGCVIPNILEAN